jgi:hypothetical protein
VPIEYCGSWFVTEVSTVGDRFIGSALMQVAPPWAGYSSCDVCLRAPGVYFSCDDAERAALSIAKARIDTT